MRARNIKPDFFVDEDLATVPFEARILMAGLWCCADKAGRLEDRPLRIRASVFPFDAVDVDALLCLLNKAGKLERYTVKGCKYIQLNTFHKDQNPHHTEKESIIPEFNGEVTVKEPSNNGALTPKIHSNPPDLLITDVGTPNTDSALPAPQAAPAGGVVPLALDLGPAPVRNPMDGFKEFYALFPRKKSPRIAEAAWRKISPSPELRAKIMTSLRAHVAVEWAGKELQHIPYPATWLNAGGWENEVEKESAKVTTPPKPRQKTDMERALERMAREMVDE